MPTRAIKAIFFTRFHHEKGSRVLHQIPEGSITPCSSLSALRNPLFSFDSATPYLIPTQQFCDRLLTFCVNHYRVIGYPVCIREGRYSRNEFIFNWAVVVEESLADWVAYGEVVRKVGRLLRGLEEQGGFVSGEEDGMGAWDDDSEDKSWRIGSGSKVFALCEMLLEDLNNYAECMIPIDDSNTINLKLFPTRPPPPPIHAHQVPILTISLSALSTPISSDLTLTRILPYIDGINSVAHIAQLADTDLSLTRKAIQHLVFYGCLVLLDIFSFTAVYAPTAEIGGFIVDAAAQEECVRYVRVPRVRWGGGSTTRDPSVSSARDSQSSVSSQASDTSTASSTLSTPSSGAPVLPHSSYTHDISPETLITLYTSLRQGLPLRQWVLDHLDLLGGIDVRRLITFGIIKGFLYRVHKYAIATSTTSSLPPAPPTSLQSAPTSTAPSTHRNVSEASTIRLPAHKNSVSNGLFAHGGGGGRLEEMSRLDSIVSGEEMGGEIGGLGRFLDGMHCFDEICSEVGQGERVVEGRVKGAGEVQVFSR
ncbi:nitrogen permease regulator 2 [Bimuria novae-zelandiae CBS 107.79]|uniref:Nitrogen permease regulator 2 n=1 Tax=Bimuria novae-zelandiae CBS 107.79 TaxID=1447943 RepID=A0A6A5V8K8_9PLEO|nr:nitrogen permease regulator 2 [Bimuria novae-zelandiae CBS 107.79]